MEWLKTAGRVSAINVRAGTVTSGLVIPLHCTDITGWFRYSL
ncbi:hypothetical protein O5476_00025 [Escherichia coli]|nr:hypothetical protein [Escherichia coli]